MAFIETLLAALKSAEIDEADCVELSPLACSRLTQLAAISPLYRKYLLQNPQLVLWLEENGQRSFGPGLLANIWEKTFLPTLAKNSSQENCINLLRHFRRTISLHVVYREVSDPTTRGENGRELTFLAEFCVQKIVLWVYERWSQRLGIPWNKEKNAPAQYAILGLGKLGGYDLNFCSDIDLIFFFDTAGQCQRKGKITDTANEYCFTQVAREVIALLQERTSAGFLYNVDVRLRPEGATGPLVRTLAGMEHYYYLTGQNWERLALLKARLIAGSKELGEAFLESIHSFRYPSHPPVSLLEEVAGTKIRIEKEVVGSSNLVREVKNGYGGIREVEFFVQTLQILEASKNPFLQTTDTLEALQKLQRYGFVSQADALLLKEAYEFYRLVENRLQMREEQQGHTLPSGVKEYSLLAQSLGFTSPDQMDERLSVLREKVRALYTSLFKQDKEEETLQEWTLLLSGQNFSEKFADKLQQWLGDKTHQAPHTFQRLICGGPHHLVTREHALLLKSLSQQFDSLFPLLSSVQSTLDRVAQFAHSYGARIPLLKMCSSNPGFFKALCLLFDRSTFIHQLLCQYPEIMEEVLLRPLGREKQLEDSLDEIALLPQDQDFPHWLWLYVKAEQVRLATLELLHPIPIEQTVHQLSNLADAAVTAALRRVDPGGELAIIALGKYGGRELSFGSDLDIIVLTNSADGRDQTSIVQALEKDFSYRSPKIGKTYDLDLRLRPYGNDGPLVTTMAALKQYHQGTALLWERQLLTRARWVTGNHTIADAFNRYLQELLYRKPIKENEVSTIWEMRLRIQREKGGKEATEQSVKSGSGGLLDIEFLCQTHQLLHGYQFPSLRQSSTAAVLQALMDEACMDPSTGKRLLDNFLFLRKVQLYLRRDRNDSTDLIDLNGPIVDRLVLWLGFTDKNAFLHRYSSCLKENRRFVEKMMTR